MGMTCYDFAGTVRDDDPSNPSGLTPNSQTEKIYFHSYWRSDLVGFGERQAWMLKSFFATQNLEKTKFILWSNGDLSQNEFVSPFLRKYPNSFSVQVVDVDVLARHTPLAGSPSLRHQDKRAWVDGDIIRLLLTWEYGGVWVDMDSLLTRDLSPLLEHEFVTQWDCYGEHLCGILHFND